MVFTIDIDNVENENFQLTEEGGHYLK